jgi:hypothetical protein
LNRKSRAKIKALDKEIRQLEKESPFTKASLRALSNERNILTRLQVELEKSIKAKEGQKGLVQRLQKVLGENATRAQTIAQTERTRALNGKRYTEALKDYRDKLKSGMIPNEPRFQWVNPLRAKVPRHQHVAISGTVLPVGKEFLPGLRYPGDPNAPASQTINCHCYIRRHT